MRHLSSNTRAQYRDVTFLRNNNSFRKKKNIDICTFRAGLSWAHTYGYRVVRFTNMEFREPSAHDDD